MNESIMPAAILIFEAWPCGCVAECVIADPNQEWKPALFCNKHLSLKGGDA